MRAVIIFISLFLYHNSGFSQPSVEPESAKKYVYHFNTLNDKETHQKFTNIFKEADFLLLGETHDSKQISLWVDHWVEKWKELGFKHFVIETGPYSAQKLVEVLRESGLSRYQQFLKEFGMPYEYADPIPFFSGIEDVGFLQKMIKHKFSIHGIDQEFVYAYPYLWDELFKIENSPEKAKLAYENLSQFTKKAYDRDENSRRYNIYQEFMSNDTIVNFYNKLGNLSEKGRALKEAIDKSLQIYNANRTRSSSHLKRVHYLRSNLSKILANNEGTKDKMIIKIGRVHAGKTRQLNAYDVGNLIHQYAGKQAKKAVHIGFLRGYYSSDGSLRDYSKALKAETGDTYYFNTHAQKDAWTLIDLTVYKNLVEKNQLSLPDSFTQQLILSDIENFDYLLIPPLDEVQSPILK